MPEKLTSEDIARPDGDAIPEDLLKGILNLSPGGGGTMRAKTPIWETAFYDFAAYRSLLEPQLIHFSTPDPGVSRDAPVDMDRWVDFDWFVRLFPQDFLLVLQSEHLSTSIRFEIDGEYGVIFLTDLRAETEVQASLRHAVAQCAEAFRASTGLALFELYLTAKARFPFVDRARRVVRDWFTSRLRALSGTDRTLRVADFEHVQSVAFWAQGIAAVVEQIGPFERLGAEREVNEAPLFGERLPTAYPFTPFRPGSVNFGFQTIYRQTWVPLGTQAGDVVRTLPLGPRQSEKIGLKVVQTRKSSRLSEATRGIETSTEASASSKDSHEVVAEAFGQFDWNLKANIAGPLGEVATGGLNGEAGGEVSNTSRDTKTFLNEAVSKSASRIRAETKIVVSTDREDSSERTQHSEITNPNDEIAVTYIYSRLQRQYEIQSFLNEVNAVVYVAEALPAPKDITADWIRRHDWILAAALKDESFRSDLETIRSWEVADDAGEPIDPRIDRLMGSLSGQAPGDRAGIPDTYANMRGTIPDLFQNMQQAYEREVERERARRAQRETFLRSVRRLRAHVYDNILHYCRAIWSAEDPDSRMMRFREIHVPVRWEFVATGAPGSYMIDGAFVPAIEDFARDTRPLSDLADLSGPIGFSGNYSIYRLRFSEQWDQLIDMINLARRPYQQISTRIRPAQPRDAAHWACYAVASPSRQEERNFRLVHVASPEPAFAVEVEQAAGVFEQVALVPFTPGRPVRFQGIRCWIEPGSPASVLVDGQVFEVSVRLLPVLEDPELRALKWSSGPLREAEAASIFTPEVIRTCMAQFADCSTVGNGLLEEEIAWETLPEPDRDRLRNRYFDYLLRNLHTRRILVDSNDVVLTREVDTMSSLEPFKAMHRYMDVLSAYEDVLSRRLENGRYAARLAEGRLGDPDIDRMTVIAGADRLADLVALDDAQAGDDDGDPVAPSRP